MADAPGISGNVGGLVVSAAGTALQCLVAGGCTFERWVQMMLDPFDLWFDTYFAGRPKVGEHSATDCDALFLIPSANPVVALFGVGIRQLEAVGCPVSASGGPCVEGYRRLGAALAADLIRQFGATVGSKLLQGYSKTFVAENPCSSRVAIDARVQLDAIYTAYVARGLIDPTTGFPPTPNVRPGPCPCKFDRVATR